MTQMGPQELPPDLPPVLPSRTYRGDCGHGKVFVTITYHPDNPPSILQVFIKVSSTIRTASPPSTPQFHEAVQSTVCDRAEAEVIGKLLSTALEHGASPRQLAALMIGVSCGHPYIVSGGRLFGKTTILSLADLVGKVMLMHMGVIDEGIAERGKGE